MDNSKQHKHAHLFQILEAAPETLTVRVAHGLYSRDTVLNMMDEAVRRERLRQSKEIMFMECDTCRAKPGQPKLCDGCLNNRVLIQELVALRRESEIRPNPDKNVDAAFACCPIYAQSVDLGLFITEAHHNKGCTERYLDEPITIRRMMKAYAPHARNPFGYPAWLADLFSRLGFSASKRNG